MSEDVLDERRRKLKFRAWRRGFREMDLLMGSFADMHIADMTDADR
ncbi:MAG: succinate dehydrogenase assembly factor 2, partial [Pseudomonadota bacterium]